MWRVRCLSVLLACALSGCAAGPDIVVAYAQTRTPPSPGAAALQAPRYRFAASTAVPGQPTPTQLDAMAGAALATIGAVPDAAHPNVSIRVTGTVNPGEYDNWAGWGLPPSYWGADYYLGFGQGVGDGWVGNAGHEWFGRSPMIPIEVSTVTLSMRDLATNKIIYQTSARHAGSAGDTNAVLATLFRAALQGYPQQPRGVRRIVLPLAPHAGAVARANPDSTGTAATTK